MVRRSLCRLSCALAVAFVVTQGAVPATQAQKVPTAREIVDRFVKASGGVCETVTVHYATADGTATLADNDYESASGLLSFASNETTKQFSVTVNGDTGFESDESFLLNLSSPTNATISDNQALGTIVNYIDRAAISYAIPLIQRELGFSATESGAILGAFYQLS